jgi:hypothetical protein
MLDLPFEKAFVIPKIELKNYVLLIAESINNILTNALSFNNIHIQTN